ncbi:hypothetical protein [Chitinophaga parva]|uniref:hypothetical protein n=1 Tax=Chitinophaga parva TaxID=2169414 RepID=UPI001056FE89|nr:hypothetical protein [Chitinophaga parva]
MNIVQQKAREAEPVFNIGDTVQYVGTDLKKEPPGTCRFDWAVEYCLTETLYKVVDVSDLGEIRIKGELNPLMPAGSFPDEIWVNHHQFTHWQPMPQM